MPTIRHGDDRLQDFSELMELVSREENLLERMGLFEKDYLTGTLATFERRTNGTDDMYSVARGADRQFAGDDDAHTAHIETALFTLDKALKAHELIDMREFGTAAEKVTAEKSLKRIIERFQRGHKRLHATVMYEALLGSTYAEDKDGNPRPNLTRTFQSMFEIDDADMFDGAAGGVKAYNLTDQNSSPTEEFETYRAHLRDKMGDNGDDYEVVILLGSGAFTRLAAHVELEDAFAAIGDAKDLKGRLGGLKNNRVFEFKGFTFVEDFSGRIGNAQGVALPKGVDMFEIKYSPADTVAASSGDTPAEEAYLFVEEGTRKIEAQSEVAMIACNTRVDLVGIYNFTI
ncbi:major capsid protein E [Vibrio phage 1.121.O._10N.286.46.C4]|nr:major capsid protein E [Vibrio phage 1.121.O._10N.286.46.C4]